MLLHLLQLLLLQIAVQKYFFFLNYPNNLIIFAENQRNMKEKLLRFIGLPWVYAGVILLAVSFIFSLTRYNWLLFLALFLILGGAAGFLYKERHNSRY